MFVDGSGQNEYSLERTFHRCLLPSFTSFGWGVSEKKIKMWKVNGRRTKAYGKVSLKWSVNIQYSYIVGKYRMNLYKLYKQVDKRAFDKLFQRVSQRVQINFYI
jgi:hypothetical protein